MLTWATLFGKGIPSREGAELWIRLAQVLGVVAMGALLVSLRSAWRIARARLGWKQNIASALVALAMLEIAWLSFGFHLLSVKLIY